ncbi:hypothetical protein QE152_g26468 [Popillia japonica]|uniref:Uncharacterized protein n=1 Tax=Popillia japonica TaxID=7064 RepID=A0AAW1JYS0_POPJA
MQRPGDKTSPPQFIFGVKTICNDLSLSVSIVIKIRPSAAFTSRLTAIKSRRTNLNTCTDRSPRGHAFCSRFRKILEED